MADQNYSNHVRWVPLYHFVLLPALVAGVVGSFMNLSESRGDHGRLFSASLIALIMVGLLLAALFARTFALRAQDRAIRVEENLRHFALTGKLLDPKLTQQQIIGLRFASDDEFIALSQRAAASGMTGKDIKKAVTTWKGDHHRV
jgi:hypothetical protein